MANESSTVLAAPVSQQERISILDSLRGIAVLGILLIGLGYFGKLERYQIYFVVAAVWIIEIIWSHIWLRYFLFGPFEWCWRSLTYRKKQPLKK